MRKAIFYHQNYPEGFSKDFPDDLLDGRPLWMCIPIVPEVSIGSTDEEPDFVNNKVMFEFAGYEERGSETTPVYKAPTQS